MKLIILILLLFFIFINNAKGESFKDFLARGNVHSGFNVVAGMTIGSFVIGTFLFIIVKVVLDHCESEDKEKRQVKNAQKRINKKNEMINKQNSLRSSSHDTYSSTKMLREVIERNPSLDKIFTSSTPNSSSPPSSPNRRSGDFSSSVNNNSSGTTIVNKSGGDDNGSPVSISPHNQRKESQSGVILTTAGANESSNGGSIGHNSSSPITSSTLKDNATINIHHHHHHHHHHSEEQQSYYIQKECEPQPIDPNVDSIASLSPPSLVSSTFGRSSNSSNRHRSSDVSPILQHDFFNQQKRSLANNSEVANALEKQMFEIIDSIEILMNSPPPTQNQHQNQSPPIIEYPVSSSPNRESITLNHNLNASTSSFRPKSTTLSLLGYLSSNTLPKDPWNLIVQRLLELCSSLLFLNNNNNTNSNISGMSNNSTINIQNIFTSLSQLELAISNFSDKEKEKKRISNVINDQRYFSPITFELYHKIIPMHEYLRNRNYSNAKERENIGIANIFDIVMPTLFRSFNKYFDEDLENKKKSFNRAKFNISDFTSISLLTTYQTKKITHKTSMFNLIEFVRALSPISYKCNSFSTLYNVVDQYHGMADDIDKILFQCDEFKKEIIEQTIPPQSLQHSKSIRSSFGVPNVDQEILDMVKLELFQMKESPNSQSPTIQPVKNSTSSNKPNEPFNNSNNNSNSNSNNLNGASSPKLSSPRITSLPITSSPKQSPRDLNNKLDDDLKFLDFLGSNNNAINKSVNNRFETIDLYLNPSIKSGSVISLEKQKNVISSSYKSLESSLNIFSSSEKFSNKFKTDSIPVIKLLLLTLSGLQDYFETGISIEQMPSVEFLEWLTNYTKITTSLNNLIIKNSNNLNNNGNNLSSSQQQLQSPPLSSSQQLNNQQPQPQPSSQQPPQQKPTNINLTNLAQRSKIRALSSPFGSPILSPVDSNGVGSIGNINNSSHSPRGASSLNPSQSPRNYSGSSPRQSPRYSPRQSPRFLNNNSTNPDEEMNLNNNDCIILRSIKEFKLPTIVERCQAIVEASQESVMITTLASFALCYKELKEISNSLNNSNNDEKLESFNEPIGVFLSSIRTTIFCISSIISPVYLL
ncbi:hypothetical protein DICPUDRAFT_99406 [Dictyostelium purpureum]|uniref:Uncharacterized protein n=1 Tax=Dictyostelium purpureum TaxID=5786 RepID=F0ZYY7_DICPU|nr:uncharacterized protein DICPUDRAFT_99406 [Dictyostelium purpureum]EGC30839.1 hypothetical protein DICPUDRAFT_99406 [Dictyostelium purpureum]|eukprot:XP_003292628.1 hypothetical protein DICPUDRAFT_99406 [Dictyostelium purpureum]